MAGLSSDDAGLEHMEALYHAHLRLSMGIGYRVCDSDGNSKLFRRLKGQTLHRRVDLVKMILSAIVFLVKSYLKIDIFSDLLSLHLLNGFS